MEVLGNQSQRLSVMGNDLGHADKAVDVAGDVAQDAVFLNGNRVQGRRGPLRRAAAFAPATATPSIRGHQGFARHAYWKPHRHEGFSRIEVVLPRFFGLTRT